MTNSSRGHGGVRPGAGRKPDPEKKLRGRDANIHALFLPGEVALKVVDAIRRGDRKTENELINYFVYKHLRGKALEKLRQVAEILETHPGLEKDPKGDLVIGEVMPSSREARDVDRMRAAELIREVEEMMNPDKIAAVVNLGVSGSESPAKARTNKEYAISKSRLDLVKRAAGEERGFWRWIRDLRHKRATDSLTREDQLPPDQEQAGRIASDNTGSGEKK